MKLIRAKSNAFFSFCIILLVMMSACAAWELPGDIPGTYTGKAREMIRYDRGGQFVYMDKSVLISLVIDSAGGITGMVGEAAFEGCKVAQNGSWIARQLKINTEYIITGMLSGKTFEKDTVINKNISIPFNIVNGELKGSLIVNKKNKSEDFPIIRRLELKKL
jgi:hypothetical protein